MHFTGEIRYNVQKVPMSKLDGISPNQLLEGGAWVRPVVVTVQLYHRRSDVRETVTSWL